jgi:hypothetical protein
MLGMMLALLLTAIFLDVLKAQSKNNSAGTYASAALVQAAPQQSSDQNRFDDWALRR